MKNPTHTALTDKPSLEFVLYHLNRNTTLINLKRKMKPLKPTHTTLRGQVHRVRSKYNSRVYTAAGRDTPSENR